MKEKTSSKQIFDKLISDLKLNESSDEINALAFAVLQYFGVSRTEVIANRLVSLEYELLLPVISRLNENEPLQYIFNEAWFCGRKFFVNSAVLIPRPETELLVEEAFRLIADKDSPCILDIGTGSGCIAISLALMKPDAQVQAIDISPDALAVAQKNANDLKAAVQFRQMDTLQDFLNNEKYDLIVSNPPYISIQEKGTLPENVIKHEPHLALFASGHDPLIFYKRITQTAVKCLNSGGFLLVEINEQFPDGVVAILKHFEFKNIRVIKDLSGKPRMVSGQVK
jgi:release factor glutamine methyltransferase